MWANRSSRSFLSASVTGKIFGRKRVPDSTDKLQPIGLAEIRDFGEE